ncbi:helix-turn-helix domain-containing protein [uncultured Polaribacter sp.]|uniref:helix-turn-helix domain-containing protein n=1 Tax=uncultured Polaribacter sp. TaxID=174711 RepID=UPI003450AC48
MEKAASFLLYQKQRTITEISESVGFNDISSFCKTFKRFYGFTPIQFKNESPQKYSEICNTNDNINKIQISFKQYIYNSNNALN